MQQVKDNKITTQKVDSYQESNCSKTCCKLSKKINLDSPQFYKGDLK